MDQRNRARLMKKPSLFYFVSIFVFSALALLSTITAKAAPCLDIGCTSTGKTDFYGQDKGELGMNLGKVKAEEAARKRRFLSGLGSSPPRCTSKCGKCMPCKPVHVPVPPGTPVTAEYYPEAWRCKCGNKLYMP